MTLNQIISRIPDEYRKEILQTSMIQKAQVVATDPSMHYLFTIWKRYVEEDSTALDMACNRCLERVLNNYKQLLPLMIQREKQNSLLNYL